MRLADPSSLPFRSFAILILLMLATAFLALAFVPVVHATNPAETNLNSCSAMPGQTKTQLNCVVTLTGSTTLVLDSASSGVSGADTVIQISGITDTKSLTWHSIFIITGVNLAVNHSPAPAPSLSEEWYSYVGASTSGSDNITVRFVHAQTTTDIFEVSVDQISPTLEYAGVNEFFQGTLNGDYASGTPISITDVNPVAISQGTLVHAYNIYYTCADVAGGCGTGNTSPSANVVPASPLTSVGTTISGCVSGNQGPCMRGVQAYDYLVSGPNNFWNFAGVTTGANTQATGFYAMVTYWTANGGITPGSTSTQVQTIGACFTTLSKQSMYLKNNTQYWYSANALGSEVVNTIQLQIESIKGSATQTLQVLIYGSTGQSPNIGQPAVLSYAKSFSISAGTKNQTITVQVNIPLNSDVASPLPFNFWAVGVVGTDHIKIQNSSVAGMTTQTGLLSTTPQPGSFSSQGTTTNSELVLCAQGDYQGLISNTVTSTTTQSANTTFVTSTITSTVNTIGPEIFATSSNWPIVFLILLLPAGLFMGATKTLAGGLMGMMVGAVLGLMMGILPAYIFIGIVIALVAIAFIIRERTN